MKTLGGVCEAKSMWNLKSFDVYMGFTLPIDFAKHLTTPCWHTDSLYHGNRFLRDPDSGFPLETLKISGFFLTLRSWITYLYKFQKNFSLVGFKKNTGIGHNPQIKNWQKNTQVLSIVVCLWCLTKMSHLSFLRNLLEGNF